MSGRTCARAECGKTVYPMEELKCLDQVWHKQCFRCASCNMVLNMKNYKGYNKTPYCEAHYPKTQATVVVDTPEMRRLQEATKNQSLVKYHEDYEKTKGKKTEVLDDPELERLKKNTQIQSNVIYHGEAGRKEHMDKSRPMHEDRAPAPLDPAPSKPQQTPQQQPSMKAPIPSNKPISPVSSDGAGAKNSPYSSKQQQSSTLIYSSELGGKAAGQKRSPISPTQAPGQQQQFGGPAGLRGKPAGGKGAPGGAVYRAMYDYKANDTDEVTFREGDVIVNCQSVDAGWMTGTVQRTGQWGMLPANYVEKVH